MSLRIVRLRGSRRIRFWSAASYHKPYALCDYRAADLDPTHRAITGSFELFMNVQDLAGPTHRAITGLNKFPTHCAITGFRPTLRITRLQSIRNGPYALCDFGATDLPYALCDFGA